MSRYKQHKTDFEEVPPERPLPLPCRVRGCHCPAYQYTPKTGPNLVRCQCKHLPSDHSEAAGHSCKKCESEITQACCLYHLTHIQRSRWFSRTCLPNLLFRQVLFWIPVLLHLWMWPAHFSPPDPGEWNQTSNPGRFFFFFFLIKQFNAR